MKSQKAVFTIFVLIILAAGFGYAYYRYFSSKSQSPTQSLASSTPENVTENTTNIDVNGSIIYSVISSDKTEFFSITPKDGTKRKIFTDQDESLKIVQAQNLTKDGKNILAVLSSKDKNISSLWFIKTSNGEKNELINNFASSTPPVISSDSKKVAYTVFSNAERDYGFSLLVCNTDGINKVKIDNDSSSISNLVFSPDGNYIAYSKNFDGNRLKSAIFKSKTDGTEKKQIFETNDKEIIYSLDWFNNTLAFSKGPTGENNLNKSEIFTMSDDGKGLKQLTSNDTHENFLNFSDDGKNLVYLSILYENNPQTANKSGQIHILDLDSKSDANLKQDADKIIGWMP